MSATEGSVAAAIRRIAVPAAAFQLLIFANNFIDYQWVQLLGEDAAAGQTQGWTIFWMIASIAQIFSTGVTAVVARRVGEGNRADAVHAATHGARGAFLSALLVGSVGWFLVPALIEGKSASPGAAVAASAYLRTMFVGAPCFFLFWAFEGTFKGHGDMHRPLRAVGTAVAINMVLDPVLIHVLGLGVMGAALATVIAFGLTGAILGWAAWRREWWRPRGFDLDLRLVGKVFRIGLPVSMYGIVFSAVYIFIVYEVGRAGGEAATAALGLGLRMEGFAYMTSVGLASAAASVVGQNLGAGRRDRAHAGAWHAVRIGIKVTGAYGLVLMCVPLVAVEWLSPGPAAAIHAYMYFRIVAIAVPFMATDIVLEGAFSGAGDTLPPMCIGIPMAVARIPLALYLARSCGWGVYGVFWALTFTSVARGLVFAFWFARGRWVHAKA